MSPVRVAAFVIVFFSAFAPVPGRAQTAPAGFVPVHVAAVVRQDTPVVLRSIGTVQSLATVLVRARVDGTLDRIAVTEGQDVKTGDLLAQIDPRPLAAVYAQAVAKRAADAAQLANAQRDLSRLQSLARSQFASRQTVDTQTASADQFRAAVQGDEALMAAAKLNLDFASITSPIDGRVGLRQVDPGNLIHAGDASGIVTVTQIRPIAMLFTLPQDTLPRLRAAMARGRLRVTALAGDDRTELARGELLTIDSAIDPATGTIRLKATFANETDSLWPGQFVNTRIETETLRDATVVPSSAVQRSPSGLFVYTIRPDQTAAVQPIEVLQDDGHVAVVANGVGVGDTVVSAGQSRLQNGTHVAVVAQPAS